MLDLNNDDTYNATQLITTFDVRRLNTEVSFDSSTMNVSYSLNSPYALTINVVDEEGNPVENGSVAIKINGITYYDYGGIVYADVVDGVATFYIDNEYFNIYVGTYNVTVLYYGSEVYRTAKSTENLTLTITPCGARIEIKDIGYTPKSGDTIKLVASVYLSDDYGYSQLARSGSAVFKINGVTLTDENGNPIKVEINSEGLAVLEYTIPVDMAAKDYVITVVYGGSIVDRGEANITMTVVKSDVVVDYAEGYMTITQGENATLTMTLYDQNNNQLERSTKYTVKINGKTFVNQALTENGVLNVTLDTDDFTNLYYDITIILGENSAYNTKVINTVLIVDPSKNSTKVE